MHQSISKLSYIQATHPPSPPEHNQTAHHSRCILRPIPRRNSPSPKWQRLQLDNSRLNKQHERNHANQNTQNIGRVVSVVDDVAGAAAINTAVLLWFKRAGEGGCHEGIFESFCGRWGGRGGAGCFGEEVD